MTSPVFSGFSKEFVHFFRDIEKNNTRIWFHAHKEEFQKYVMEPARAFVSEMGLRLLSISPYIYAEPKVNRSIFRLARDTRRQKNLPPYKTQLAMIFWEGPLSRLDAPGFYCALSADKLMLGCGIYRFTPEVLSAYREMAADPKWGKELQKVQAILKKQGYKFEGEHYKRLPRGHHAQDMNAPLLRHNGLYIYTELRHAKELSSGALLDFVFAEYAKMAPLHLWLNALAQKTVQKDKTLADF